MSNAKEINSEDLMLIKKCVENNLRKLEGLRISFMSKNQNVMNCEKNIKRHKKLIRKIAKRLEGEAL